MGPPRLEPCTQLLPVVLAQPTRALTSKRRVRQLDEQVMIY
jgi:hypothetical protein